MNTANERLATIDISKESLNFSAAHFTIFNEKERERLHGHNFHVRARVKAPVDKNGLVFNYKILKEKLKEICFDLDEYVLLPEKSPYLNFSVRDDFLEVYFNNKIIPFLTTDVKLLPIYNATVEEYSNYILGRLLRDDGFVCNQNILELSVGVSSGAGQWGTSSWTKSSG